MPRPLSTASNSPMRHFGPTRAQNFRRCLGLRSLGLVPCVLGALTSALGAQQIAVATLLQLRDQFRPVLIFAPRPDDPQMEIQIRTLQEHTAEARDRDLAVIAIPYGSPSPTRLQLTPQAGEAARRRFGVGPATFAVILLGKDGREKLRSARPVSVAKLAAVIDAMPMRQEEVRAKTRAAGQK